MFDCRAAAERYIPAWNHAEAGPRVCVGRLARVTGCFDLLPQPA